MCAETIFIYTTTKKSINPTRYNYPPSEPKLSIAHVNVVFMELSIKVLRLKPSSLAAFILLQAVFSSAIRNACFSLTDDCSGKTVSSTKCFYGKRKVFHRDNGLMADDKGMLQ